MTEEHTAPLDMRAAEIERAARLVVGISPDEDNTSAEFCDICRITTAHGCGAGCINCWAMARARLGIWEKELA